MRRIHTELAAVSASAFKLAATLFVAVAIVGVPPVAEAAPTMTNDVLPKPLRLGEALTRVAEAASGEGWRQEGWSDPVLEKWLGNVVQRLNAAAAGADARAVPVRFADVKPIALPLVADGGKVPGMQDALAIGRNMSISRAQRSIILADGNARVGFATDCVIVARGAVYVAHGRGNVIIAGHFVHVSHDGRSQPVLPRGGVERIPGGRMQFQVVEPGSIVLSNGTVNVSHATDGMYMAGKSLNISNATGCDFVDPPPEVEISQRTDCRDIKAVGLRVHHQQHPLEAEIQIDWVLPDRAAVIRFREKRYVADRDKPITDESGKPVDALAGWKLSFCHDRYAMFTDGKADFGVIAEHHP